MTRDELIEELAHRIPVVRPITVRRNIALGILNAIDAAGFAVVPKEPSEAMVDAGYAMQSQDDSYFSPFLVWTAMLAAAEEQKQ